jgi:hypothetical protein
MAVAWYILSQSRPISSGFSPIRISRSPREATEQSGASMIALVTVGLVWTSPMPVMPSSVRMRISRID